jgi:hypothetical protein
LGLEHEPTVNTAHNLGIIYFHPRKVKEAAATPERAPVGREKVLGLEHVATLDTVHKLGSIYYF